MKENHKNVGEFQADADADAIANTLGAKRRIGDWDNLRDYVDGRTAGELDTFQLDMLTDMVEARARRIWGAA